MILRVALVLVVLVLLVLGGLLFLGRGGFEEPWHAGTPTASPIPEEVRSERGRVQRRAVLVAGTAGPKQILFGDLHVHTTFSGDAFQLSLPVSGGDGASGRSFGPTRTWPR